VSISSVEETNSQDRPQRYSQQKAETIQKIFECLPQKKQSMSATKELKEAEAIAPRQRKRDRRVKKETGKKIHRHRPQRNCLAKEEEEEKKKDKPRKRTHATVLGRVPREHFKKKNWGRKIRTRRPQRNRVADNNIREEKGGPRNRLRCDSFVGHDQK
jgi:hypothetical protein